jgi:DNA polymerase-3 subunit delta'
LAHIRGHRGLFGDLRTNPARISNGDGNPHHPHPRDNIELVATFRTIVGHQRVKGLLAGAVKRGSIPPTLLFAGPSGVGKSLTASATAAALNCLSPLENVDGLALDACGECRACDRIARRVHVEVSRLAPDDMGVIKIDAVRDVLERTGFRPFEGRRRVVIIDRAETLLDASQNALLKSLEEPPPSTIFVLTTAVPAALLPTVRSRCMRLRFGRLTEAEVAAVLLRDPEIPPKDARAAAALADGSVGQALALASADLALLRELALQLLRQAGAGRDVASKLQGAASVIYAGTKKERSRDDVGLILRMAASMLRDVELLNTGGDPVALANGIIADELSSLTRAYAGDRARDAFAAVDKAIAALERNAGPKVVADWLATQI